MRSTTTIISSVISVIVAFAVAAFVMCAVLALSQHRRPSACPPGHCYPHNAGCCCGPTCPCPSAASPPAQPRVPPRGSIDTSDDADGTAEDADAGAEEQERNHAICIDGQCCPADTQVATARGPAGTSGETPRNGAFACERCKTPTVGRDWHEIWAGDTSLLCVCKTCWGQMRPPERQSVLTQYAHRTGKSNNPDVQRVISSLAR